jgi:DNA modification methylase
MNRVFYGDCRTTMRELAAQGVRVQCCVTSPPYFGLRDYGHPGQIGLEKTPAEYVAALVEVFEGVRELLADDGVLWLNLGDSYANDTKWGGSTSGKHMQAVHGNSGIGRNRHTTGLPGKNLIGIPWRVAFALQTAGWYLRQDIIWHKPNPMPESVTDRCTKAHEYLFLLTKSERYYWDAEAMQEPATGQIAGNVRPTKGVEEDPLKHRTRAGLHAFAERQRSKRDSFKRDDSKRAEVIPGQTVGTHRADRDESEYDTGRRNRRSVWTVATQPYSGAHFAVFPAALIEPCILAGSRAGDVVLDPFMGSGTTAQVAQALGRQWIGCELNPEYAPLQQERTAQGALAL